MLIHGNCHCGNVRYTLAWEPDPTEIPARACGCTFCTRHGAVWTSKADGALRVTIADPTRVSRYAFGTKTAEFLICSRCGIVPLVTSRLGGRDYAVINVNTFDGIDAAMLRRAPASFDGETESERLARRKRNWIGDVAFVASS
jgi:hypothetical protein